MSFNKEYASIKNQVKELSSIEQELKEICSLENPFYESISCLLLSPAKRLRPLLAILFVKSLREDITDKQKEFLTAVELIHNASLIHDDVIDKAKKRRHCETINSKFDNNMAVVAGDYLLAIALEKIVNTNSKEVINITLKSLKTTCIGEINQYYKKYQIPTIDEYIEKSRNKTAKLFEIAIYGSVVLSNESKEICLASKKFAQNFGIAFQIRDDLKNILEKGTSDDIAEGIYTAPVIFANEEKTLPKDTTKILTEIKASQGIEKTKNLIDNYFDKAVNALKNLSDDENKQKIINIINILKKSI